MSYYFHYKAQNNNILLTSTAQHQHMDQHYRDVIKQALTDYDSTLTNAQKEAPKGHLSGFTNSGVHIQMNVDGSPLKSTNTVFSSNLFSDDENNFPPFYGAEAIFFQNDSVMSIQQSKEIIDLKTLFETGNSVAVGYIFGGIEAFISNPGTYGKTKSRASNKIWKVTLKKE